MRERGLQVPLLLLGAPSCPEVEEKGPVCDLDRRPPLGTSVSSSLKRGDAKERSDDIWKVLASGLRVPQDSWGKHGGRYVPIF